MLDTYNILMLGGAKRVTMVRYFKAAAKKLGKNANIFSYEIDTHAPISLEGKVIRGLKWDDPLLYDDLKHVVEQYSINVVVPFVDGAVSVAANLASMLPDRVFAPTCDAEVAEMMFDKVTAAEIFAKESIPTPATVTEADEMASAVCLIAKPAKGSASKGIIEINDITTLKRILARQGEYLVQERIDNRDEYTVDCYVSRSGQPLCIVPRKRIEVSGGEVTRTATVINFEVYDLAKSILAKLPLRGAITIQILVDKTDGRALLMEINPRLGGGAVCAVAAQADIPALILEEAAGGTPQPTVYRPYTEIARYPQEVIFFN